MYDEALDETGTIYTMVLTDSDTKSMGELKQLEQEASKREIKRSWTFQMK